QIVLRSLAISYAAFVAILVLWYNESFSNIVHPLRMFINNIHGGLSAFAIQITGGAAHSFTLSPAGSYVIEFSGGADAITMPAGYLGSALLGAVMFFLVNRAPHLVRGMAMITGAFTVGFLALFIRPDATGDWISMFICIGFGLVLIVLGWTGRGDVNQLLSRRSLTQIVMTIASLMTACHILLDLPVILNSPAMIDGAITNPIAYFSENVMPALSVQVVAISWSAIAIALLAAAFYFSISRQLRQIPKNDDIV
ncbi:MAG: M50 family metallopeptidase, partial [Anaerolineae bacterium]|nr:M50 family metallopeptidase [Anaerolineae bacterium]